MYQIAFYRDRQGRQAVVEFLDELRNNSAHSKDARINFNKISLYLEVLERKGTRAGLPYVKHLEGDLWELRPLKKRILFAHWHTDTFVILHLFEKRTMRAPRREIEKALIYYKDFSERMGQQ